MLCKFPHVRIALAVLFALVALPLSAHSCAGAEKQADDAQVPVDFFQAVKAGQIEAKVIFKNSKQGNLLIKNKGQQPLQIRMPDGFAGKPVLAQFNGGAGLNNGLNNNALGGNNVNQALGAGGGVNGGGLGNGLFNVAPEQLKKIPLVAVCLEHGKKEPNPHVQYEIVPIEQYSNDPRIHELVHLLNTGKLNQRAAQVAAWNLANGMSFDELAAKTLKYANGTQKPYFSRAELMSGIEIVRVVTERARVQKQAEPQGSLSGQ